MPELQDFAQKLEQACLDTLNAGIMTKDLCHLAQGIETKEVNSEEFIHAIQTRLNELMA